MAAWASRGTYGDLVPRPEAIDLIHAAFERGVTHFGTAEIYGPWTNRPHPRPTNLHRLEENLAAANVVLTADDLREIDEGAANIRIEGARLSEAVLAMSETE
jgi:aryl-alcohol dehydrogenase-like predicted oxidoreductase